MLGYIFDKPGDPLERIVQRFLAHWLRQIRKRSRLESLLTALDTADDVHRNVPRARMMLEPLQNLPSVETGHVDVERNRVGPVFVRRRQSAVTIEADDSLESLLARHPEQNLREVRVVLDDEHRSIARIYRLVIILDHVLSSAPFRNGRRCCCRRCRSSARRSWPPRRIRRYPRRPHLIIDDLRANGFGLRTIAKREEQRERAALAGSALYPDLTAKKSRDLTTDRQTQACAAELAAGRSVSLLERLEYQPLLVRSDADPGIRDRERDHATGVVERRLQEAAVRLRLTNRKRYAPLMSEFECVRQKVAQDLLHALSVGIDGRWHLRMHGDRKAQSPLRCDRTEASLERRVELGD